MGNREGGEGEGGLHVHVCLDCIGFNKPHIDGREGGMGMKGREGWRGGMEGRDGGERWRGGMEGRDGGEGWGWRGGMGMEG